MLRRSFRFAPLMLALQLTFVACGGGDDGSSPATAGPGGNAAGAGGSSSGGSGGAQAGGGGHVAGSAGSPAAGGSSGATGASGHGGGAGGAHAGNGGGGAGAGGNAGASNVGGGGSGGAGSCNLDGDCKVPTTVNPPGCAVATCETTSHTCQLLGADKDGDGHRTSVCADKNGAAIVLGDDCDDTDPQTYPKAWDGPKDATHPDRCDGVDQDCDGKADDTVGAGGITCTCTPGDLQACKEDSSGKPIVFPPGPLQGECKFGSKVCLANGTYGPCTDAVGPTPEVCDSLDNDCNGKKDDNPTDPVKWVYDGDDDGHAAMGCDSMLSCVQTPPSGLPQNCPAGPNQPGTCPTCTPDRWKHDSAIPSDDCDDDDPSVHPNAMEVCDEKDNNCNQQIDEGFQVGMVCDVGAVHVGACLGGGLLACAPDLTAKCYPPPGVTIPGDYGTKPAPNGSWDWNCDGTDSQEYAATVCHHTDMKLCDTDETNKCLGLMHPDCGGTFPAGSFLAYEQLQVQTMVLCGDGIRVVQCMNSGPTCNTGTPMNTTERCR